MGTERKITVVASIFLCVGMGLMGAIMAKIANVWLGAGIISGICIAIGFILLVAIMVRLIIMALAFHSNSQ